MSTKPSNNSLVIARYRARIAELKPRVRTDEELANLDTAYHAAYDALQAFLGSIQEQSIYSDRDPRAEEIRRLRRAEHDANEALKKATSDSHDAVREINQIERKLGAADRVKELIATLEKQQHELADEQEKSEKFSELEVQITAELESLKSERTNLLERHTKAEIAARLRGEAPTDSSAIADLDRKVETRSATKAAAAQLAAEAQARIEQLREGIRVTEGGIRGAQHLRAELAWEEAIESLMPLAAAVLVSAYYSRDHLEVAPSKEVRAAAETALRAEISPPQAVKPQESVFIRKSAA